MAAGTKNAGQWSAVAVIPSADGSATAKVCDITWDDGRLVSLGPASKTPSVLVLPGFVDLHVHWPQGHVRGQFSGQLLPWLRDCIWPAEARFAELPEASARARQFAADMLRAGTTASMTFGPPYLQACLGAGLEVFDFDGPALMEVNAPADMCRPAEEVLAEIAKVPSHRSDGRRFCRSNIVVTPRFAPTMTVQGLAACGDFARAHGLLIQSHVSENTDEVDWVRALFPDALDYTDVYDRAGLLGRRTVLAHGIHLSDRELQRLTETGTVIAHCPTSNLALHSGRMPLERLRAAGTRWVLATDVGAGPRVSQLDVMAAFLSQHAAAGVEVSATEALARATLFPGDFLAEHDPTRAGLGRLQVGAAADLVAYALPADCRVDDDAETLLRGLLRTPAALFETLPVAVIRGGKHEISAATRPQLS